MHRIDINECKYPGAWIEVGLKASAATRSSTRNQLNQSSRSNMTDVQAATTSEANPSMTEANYRELLDKFAD